MAYAITCLAPSCNHGTGTEEQSSVYFGETGRSNFERGTEHERDLRNEVEDTPMWKHCQVVHESEKVEFKMETTGVFSSCEERQTDEGSRVKLSRVRFLMNSKSEFNQPPIIRVTTETGNTQETQGGGTATQGRQTGRGGRNTRAGGRGAGRGRTVRV
jgi:hypothetical protein